MCIRDRDTHIKAGALLPVYLLYGEENRQIEAARERLVKTAVSDGDSMNLLRCAGSGEVDWDGIADLLWSCLLYTSGHPCTEYGPVEPVAGRLRGGSGAAAYRHPCLLYTSRSSSAFLISYT